MYLVASVRLSVRPYLSICGHSHGCMCVYNQSAYADNCTDAVDQLLIVSKKCGVRIVGDST